MFTRGYYEGVFFDGRRGHIGVTVELMHPTGVPTGVLQFTSRISPTAQKFVRRSWWVFAWHHLPSGYVKIAIENDHL